MGIITNIGPVHLEGFGTIKGVFREKISLIPHIRSGGTLVIHQEDVPEDRIASTFDGTLVTFGFKESADFYAVGIEQDINRGTEFLINGKEKLLIPVLGEHNVLNALAALAAAKQLGASMGAIAQGLATFSASAMRMQICKYHGATILNDAYNANPRAMREAILTAVSIPAERRIFAFGDMLELGEHAHEAHFSLGRHIGGVNPDFLFLVGTFSDDVRDGALEAGMQPDRLYCCNDTGEIATSLRTLLRTGDLLLVKGSRGMRMENVIQRLIEED
jgi:UDP-N-acetylmuramoyl-tripeptide--D-alanyl-D-alanine ligase